jgi:hypothetical protein
MKSRIECALFAQSRNANEIKKEMWSARSTANNNATAMQTTSFSIPPPALMKLILYAGVGVGTGRDSMA